MSGKGSRKKGQDGQREAMKLWKAAGFTDAKHSGMLQQGFAGGRHVPDIFDVGRWWVEVKRYRDYTDGQVLRWWLQVVAECPKTHDPILMYRKNNGGWLVMTKDHERPISWESFVEEVKREKRRTAATKRRELQPNTKRA